MTRLGTKERECDCDRIKRVCKCNFAALKILMKLNLSSKQRLLVKIIGAYLLCGGIWIYISDKVFSLLISKYEINSLSYGRVKEWIFMLLTSIIIYFVINKFGALIGKEELQRAEERLRLAIDSTTDGLWDWNIETNEAFLSTKWKKKLGFKDNEVLNAFEEWLRLIYPEDKGSTIDKINKYLNKEIDEYNIVFRMVGKHNNIRWILSRGQGIWDKNGMPVRMVGTHTDITDKKEAEEKLERALTEKERLLDAIIEKDRIRTEYFTNITHEFRTLLNVILGTVQLIDTTNREEKTTVSREKMNIYVKTMKNNCYRLLRLINNLLDFTKIDAGFLEMNLKRDNIISIVEDIVMSVAQFAEDNEISIEFDTEIEERYMLCDCEKIERIVLNLLSNSIKYTNPGGSIWVNMFNSMDNVIISVKDTGTGIPENKLNSIFERFVQLNSGSCRGYEGTGIGLSLVKSFVDMHGGTIEVKSKVGEGSEFIIKLPVNGKEDIIAEDKSPKITEERLKRVNIEFSDIE